MSPARRGKVWWTLGALVVLAVLIILNISGKLTWFQSKETKKALCWVSPQNPNYIKEAPGKDPEGHELVPVYATPAGEKPGGPAPSAPAPRPQPNARSRLITAPCIPRSSAASPAPARNAAWP